MSKNHDKAVMNLIPAYGEHFAQHYTETVANHLGASFKASDIDLSEIISAQISNQEKSSEVVSTNTVTRFLYECAEHAIQSGEENAADRDVFNQIIDLPSKHHVEISALMYDSASIYRYTIDNVIIGTIGRDAATVVGEITNKVEAQVTCDKSGSNIHRFGWGMLSDGMWLNNALMKAYDIARIFHPNDKVNPSMASTAFDFCGRFTAAPVLEDTSEVAEEVVKLFDSCDKTAAHGYLPTLTASHVSDLMFSSGHLYEIVSQWKHGLKDTAVLIEAVGKASALTAAVESMIATAAASEEEVSDITKNRLHAVRDCLTLCLAGFEALRSSTYENAIILAVLPTKDDMTVDVFVNEDTMDNFIARGNTEEELSMVGMSLDPRRGAYVSNTGWSVSWVSERKEDICNKVRADEAARMEKVRINDNTVIRNMVTDTLMNLAQGYSTAAGKGNISQDIKSKIGDITHKVISKEDATFNLEVEISKLLAQSMGDPFVISMTDTFLESATSEDENIRKNARPITLVTAAAADACNIVFS